MTCKDCIHYDVCEDNLKYIQERFLKGLTFGKSEFTDGEFCNLFKDKSRIIEPTLNIGEKVWFLNRNSNEICEATVIRVEYNYFTKPPEWIEIEYISFSIGRLTYKTRIDLMLGKVVFFTKEEAEAKLKELNEK